MAIRFLLLMLAALLLGSCGFHLRGQADLPPAMAVTAIVDNQPPNAPPGDLALALGRALEANGIDLTDDPDEATAVIRILYDNLNRRTLATGPRGEIREYNLRYQVGYSVITAGGDKLIPKDEIVASRDLLYAETRVLGREAGEDIALSDMVGDVAYTILRRLQVLNQ